MKSKRGSLFRSSSGALAIRPQALSLFWLFGCGAENENVGRTTIVTVRGPLQQRSGWWDGYDAIVARFAEACADKTTSTVLLRIDSPGGDCAGCFEAVRTMRALAKEAGKRVVAFADESAYSAAYAIACVADEVYVPRSGGVGSVGVIATCYDVVALNEMSGVNVAVVTSGERKADCNPNVPLSEIAISGVQEDVDRLAALFFETVSEARGISTADVEALEADCFMGDDAASVGLADGVMSFAEVLSMLDGDLEKGTTTMTEKNKASKLIPAAVAAVDHGALGAIASRLSGKPSASEEKEEKAEDEEEEHCEEEETEEEASEDAEDEGEESDDSEEEEDAEDEETEKAISPPVDRSATSASVLRMVREMTGETSPAAQLGALRALSEKASRADKAEKAAARQAAKTKASEHKSLVEASIRSGKLAPSQRSWAMSVTGETLRGYLKNATPNVKTKSTKVGAKPTEEAAGAAPEITATMAKVARTLGIDPAKVAKHHAELKAKGIVTH